MGKPVKVTQETLDRLGVRIIPLKDRKPITDDEMAVARAQPTIPKERRKRRKAYVTLDPLAHAIAKKLGNGNVSRGIDTALFAYQEHEITSKVKKRVKRL